MKTAREILACLAVILAIYFTSWMISVAIIWVIFKLFGWAFSFKVATGIWLVLVLIESFLKGAKK